MILMATSLMNGAGRVLVIMSLIASVMERDM
jgi:hypothetical protein